MTILSESTQTQKDIFSFICDVSFYALDMFISTSFGSKEGVEWMRESCKKGGNKIQCWKW